MKNGFTLIELMIVVVVIGILAAIAVPKFQDVAENSRRATCRANMRTIASQQVIYIVKYSTYADNLDDLGLSGVMCPSRQPYTITGTASSYSIHCIAPDVAHGNIVNGVISWAN